ncbi:MAG: hypothetical protein JJU29_23215 [Verrucomicrobia bacterium]|nr:hypothetical protein [Verrucomicrobiota bacterium]MCH8513565.1 hypothetical protein [Kiritimatiellia bacterium]
MNAHDRLKDPLYAQLIFHIETFICHADETAKSKNIHLTDSQIRSAVLRTIKVLKGQSPAIPQENERDKLLAQLVENLIEIRKDFIFEEVGNEENQQTISKPIWLNACETLLSSINIRKSDVPGSRYYLDYVHKLIQNAQSS